ncbi:hypothetical protein BASA62_006821 [Batrachochytrium salamandrivorans]|nr:hypothetical protein BASA62_006821 [Batrachochytrium salamandrivorans]
MLENLAGTMRSKSEYIRIDDPSEGYSYHNDYDSDDDLSVTIARPVHVPRMPKSFGGPDTLPLPISLRGRHLQVIVKLASIHLTPDKPRYNGGSWHIEETETNQHLGSLDALPGRCIVFPNMLQHKVMPFELADPSKPGVRKILAFFLIDPSKRIVSTAHTPPQQPDWYTVLLERYTHSSRTMGGCFQVYSWEPCHWRKPDLIRLELMQERSAFADTLNEYVFEKTFNLDEH